MEDEESELDKIYRLQDRATGLENDLRDLKSRAEVLDSIKADVAETDRIKTEMSGIKLKQEQLHEMLTILESRYSEMKGLLMELIKLMKEENKNERESEEKFRSEYNADYYGRPGPDLDTTGRKLDW